VTRADVALVILIAAAIGWLAATHWQPAAAAAQVEVRVAGQTSGTYPLDHARDIEVSGPLGVSVLQVRDGRVRFARSPCRNKVCIHSGWLQYSGDATACLPNAVSIALSGRGAPEIDAVAH
jgi:hypothetical protein